MLEILLSARKGKLLTSLPPHTGEICSSKMAGMTLCLGKILSCAPSIINFGKGSNDTSLKIDKTIIKPSKQQKLLGISIDNNLSFKGHVQSICKKASQKLHALSRISNYMDDRKVKQTMHVFILSQFSYCPLIWMFCDRQMNNRINRIHEKSLRLAYDDYESSFQNLLEKDNSTSIHDKNLQLLLTEIYKTLHNLNPSFMKEIFTERNTCYNLRNISRISLSKPKSNCYGIESTTFMGSKLWQELTNDIKTSSNLAIFKKKIKTWKDTKCNCRLCKPYVAQIGFLK